MATVLEYLACVTLSVMIAQVTFVMPMPLSHGQVRLALKTAVVLGLCLRRGYGSAVFGKHTVYV